MKRQAQVISLLLCVIILATLLSGCKKTSENPAPADPNNATGEANSLVTEKVNLYFSDDQAMYLIAESRDIKLAKDTKNEATIAEAIVNELIAGPNDTKLRATIPKETKLLSLKITDQIAYVDFSEEIKSNHPGGSSGETMTIYSIVNSLTDVSGINKVQILIKGSKVETLVGHEDLTQPLSKYENLVKK
ncbi:MAG: GerMN domain-containing protein [Syntrophomonas sp.]|nr:GerMN domain-containing protein [Syntrophomonas sp.]